MSDVLATDLGGRPGYFQRFLSLNGLGAVTNAIGDYSGAESVFSLLCPAGSVWQIDRWVIAINGTGSLGAATYGPIAGLGNGFRIGHRRLSPAGLEDLTAGRRVQNNRDLSSHFAEIHAYDWAANTKTVIAHVLQDSGPIYLDGDRGDSLEWGLNDNLSTLTLHTAIVSGHVMRGPWPL